MMQTAFFDRRNELDRRRERKKKPKLFADELIASSVARNSIGLLVGPSDACLPLVKFQIGV